MKQEEKKIHLPVTNNQVEELEIVGFEEVKTPEADVVSLGSASYTKMLGKIFA